MRLPGRRFGVAAAALVAVAALAPGAPARAETAGVLLVVANRISVDDAGQSGIEPFLRDCHLALISPQLTGRPQEGAVFATISAGTPSRGADEYGLMLEAREPFEGGTAAQAYARRTAFPEPPGGLVHLGMARVADANRKLKAKPQVWLLGEALREAGIGRAAFGSADVSEESLRKRSRNPSEKRSRMGAALVADRYGIVPEGIIGAESVRKAPHVPGGLATGLDLLRAAVLKSLAGRQVAVVEFGDLERIEQERINCTPEAYRLARAEALERLGEWLTGMRRALPDTPILLISPVPPLDEEGRWNRLGFAAMAAGGQSQGLLTSNSTRTPGIIAASDIAPTLVHAAGVAAPGQMGGYRAEGGEARSPVETLRRWDLTVRLKKDLALPVILGLGILAALSGTLAIWTIAHRPCSRTRAVFVLFALGLTAWIPLLLLFPLDRPSLYFALAPGVIAAFALARRVKGESPFFPLEAPALLLLGSLALSAFGGLDWTKRSPLCGWQFSGLRYYGIGNEFMGCIIAGAAIIPLWRFGGRHSRIDTGVLAAWFAFWVLVLGMPMLGANFGGAVAATVTFGLVARALAGRQTRVRDAALLTLAGILVAFALAVLDAAVSGWSPSHLGHAVRVIQSGDSNYLLAMLQRKISMNLDLGTSAVGGVTFGVFAIVSAAWALYRKQMLESVRLASRIVQGMIGMGYGALVALIFNDSGIVSAAFMFAFALLWWLWFAVAKSAGGLPSLRNPVANSRN